jgi:hypothetical protein
MSPVIRWATSNGELQTPTTSMTPITIGLTRAQSLVMSRLVFISLSPFIRKTAQKTHTELQAKG